VPILLKMGVMFGGLLPGYPARELRSVTHVRFEMPSTTKCGLKVISN